MGHLEKKTVSAVMPTLLLISMLTLGFNIQAVRADPETIYVDAKNVGDPFEDGSQEHPFDRIQEGVNAANLGDTIYVYNGTYYENVVVNKTVTLIGEDMHCTIIDGNSIGTVMYITVNNVKVTGFTIQGSGYGGWLSGVWVSHSSGSNISQNIIKYNQAGILLWYSSDITVDANTAISNTYDGIILYNSSNNTVAGNIASNNMYGIALSYFSDSNTVTGNTASNNMYGISLWYDSDDNRVTSNNASNNDNGIYLFDSNFNLIFHNNFIGNTIQAYSMGSMNIWDNGYPTCGNHWSDYTDQDSFIGPCQNEPGGDEVWDHPYVIDSDNQDRYPLVNPWTPSWTPPLIPPGVFADLTRRRAWPEHHHYAISRHEDAGLTLYAKVKNLGNQTAWVKAIFKITKEDGSTRVIETEPLMTAQEEIAELSAKLAPFTEQDVGKYFVSAFCWYSHNKIVWAQGEKTNSFSFAVAP